MSNKINTLKKKIAEYLELDNEIKSIEKKAKEKKKEKSSLEKYLIDTFKYNKLYNKEIAVTSNKALFFLLKTIKKEALSQKYIKKTLLKFFISLYSHTLRKERCEEKALEIFDYLLENRDQKKSYNLKIIKNN